MANVKRCDRCKKIFELKNTKLEYTFNIKYIIKDPYCGCDVDLCDKCLKEMHDFLFGGDKNADNM